jgi:hypothetical protein
MPAEIAQDIKTADSVNTPTINYIRFVANQTDKSAKRESGIANSDTPRVNPLRVPALINFRNALSLYRRRLGQHLEIDLTFLNECRADQSNIAGDFSLEWGQQSRLSKDSYQGSWAFNELHRF